MSMSLILRCSQKILCLLLASLFFTSCASPGEGKKARQGKSLGNIVVAAIEKYYEENGKYPSSLDELESIPSDVNQNPGRGDLWFNYSSQESHSYTLVFKYYGPGVNICEHGSAFSAEEWRCTGGY